MYNTVFSAFKHKVLDLIFKILVVLLFVYCIIDLGFGIDTIWDEGFYLKWLDEPLNNEQISQSFNIINTFFGFFKSNLLIFRIIAFLFKLGSFTLFIFIIYKGFLKVKYKLGKVEILFFTSLFLPTYISYSNVINYRDLQQIFILLTTAIIFNYHFETNRKREIFYLFQVSILIFFSIINIPPSGILILGLIFFYVLLLKKNKFDWVLLILFSILSFCFVNFFFIDLFLNFKAIINNSKNAMNARDGHSFISLLQNYIPFIKLFIFKYFLLGTIIYLIRRFVLNYFLKQLLFITVVLLSYYWYGFSLDFLVIFLTLFINYNIIIEKRNYILVILLILIPLISVFGSNTSIFIHLQYFIPCWGILLFLIMNKRIIPADLNIIYISMIFHTMIIFYSFIKEHQNFIGSYFNSSEYFENSEKIRNIAITKSQKIYFTNVNSILKKYKFNAKKDHFFSLHTDFMTVYVFDGKLNTVPYHQLSSYVMSYNKYDLSSRPDYLFLDSNYSNVISKFNNWNFPQNYDLYKLKSPNENNENRYMYCLNPKFK